jgi:hypothetical protein
MDQTSKEQRADALGYQLNARHCSLNMSLRILEPKKKESGCLNTAVRDSLALCVQQDITCTMLDDMLDAREQTVGVTMPCTSIGAAEANADRGPIATAAPVNASAWGRAEQVLTR